MRKIVGAGLLTALVIGPLWGPTAASPRTRKATAPYDFDLTDPGITGWFGQDLGVFFGNAVELDTRRGEKSVGIEVEDDSGAPITAGVWQEDEPTQVICMRSAVKIPIVGGKPVFVQVFVDATFAAGSGCAMPEVPTKGTVTATFSRSPKL